jgi:hypothetical protein
MAKPSSSSKASTSKKSKDPQMKFFRSSLEFENFFRFVHENSLRQEAKILLEIVLDRIKKGLKKSGKTL